jgi:hypothetical protein
VRRQVERFEFNPTDAGAVLDAMATISQAADGWINLLPGIDEDAAPPTSTGITALLAPRVPGSLMGTWAPETDTRRGREGAKIGLLHTAGRFAARQLAALGLPLPDGWIVRQDNPRRGLIVLAAVNASNKEVLDWMIAAGTALCGLETSGMWRADVYLPRTVGAPEDQ